MFNEIMPWKNFLTAPQYSLPAWGRLLMSTAVGAPLLGLNVMVIGLVMITFVKQNKNG